MPPPPPHSFSHTRFLASLQHLVVEGVYVCVCDPVSFLLASDGAPPLFRLMSHQHHNVVVVVVVVGGVFTHQTRRSM